MLTILNSALIELPALIKNKSLWQSLDINDETPKVERLWCEWEENRIYLHKISPCKDGTAYYHTHPWPSAMYILKGEYKMGIGLGSIKDKAPVISMNFILPEGAKYEMIEENSWHFVQPLKDNCYTLMVTGKPYDQSLPKSERSLSALSHNKFEQLYETMLNIITDKFFFKS